jgi:hypothetical protein
MWEGRLRIVETGDKAVLKLEVCAAASNRHGCGRVRWARRELIVNTVSLPGENVGLCHRRALCVSSG